MTPSNAVEQAIEAAKKDVIGEMIGIHLQSGRVDAYLAKPRKQAYVKGAVIVAHEIWGLTDHIKQVADRLALLGYYSIAPDLYSGKNANRRLSQELQQAMFDKNDEVRYRAQPRLRALIAPTQTPQFTTLALSRLESCFEYMYNQPLVHQKVAMVGFGLGGNYAFSMAIREPRLRAVVPFYGQVHALAAELRQIVSPIMAFYGGKDTALATELPLVASHMRDAGVDFTSVAYAAAGHAFFNDANPFAYQPRSADDAWGRLVAFLHDTMV